MLQRLRGLDARRAWDILLVAAFIPGVAYTAVVALIYPLGIGSHANIYTAAAAAWVQGNDPWAVGPPAAVFAGPPPMLLPFVPFIGLPTDVTRILWFVGDILIAAWVLRRLGMPAYWLIFPPMFDAIVLGHIEVLVLAAIVLGGAFSGVAAVVKPYAALPLLAERRWTAFAFAVVAVVLTFPVLPWPRFFAEYGTIAATLARQDVGDSVFGDPVLMIVAAGALLALGPRRALWLAVPVLWPYAQPIYKSLTMPVLAPVLALFWGLPLQGATLMGLVVFAALVSLQRFRRLPRFLVIGIEPAAKETSQAAGRPLRSTRFAAA